MIPHAQQRFILRNTGLFLVLWGIAVVLLGGLWLAPDSLNYISLSRGLLDGNVFYNYNQVSTTWPLGYPTLIAIVYGVTGNLTFSLLLIQGVLLSIILIMTQRLAQRLNIPIDTFVSVLLFSLLFTLWLVALSELLFIVWVLLWVDVMLGKIKHRGIWIWLLLLAMMETRHIGVVFVPLSVGFEMWRQGWTQKAILQSLLLCTAIPVVWGFHIAMTGSLTGPRVPNQDRIFKITLYAFTSFHSAKFYLRILTSLIIGGATVWLVYKHQAWWRSLWPNALRQPDTRTQVIALLTATVIAYGLFLYFLRVRTQFDMINFRLMGPIVPLVAILLLAFYAEIGKIGKGALWLYFSLCILDQARTQIPGHTGLTTASLYETPIERAPEVSSPNAKIMYACTGVRVTQAPTDSVGWTIFNAGVHDLQLPLRDTFLWMGGKKWNLDEGLNYLPPTLSKEPIPAQ